MDCLLLQVLSFAVKPRALWVAAHHLVLSGRMDGLWGALLNAVADLVSGNEADYDTRRSVGSLPVLPFAAAPAVLTAQPAGVLDVQ